MVEIICVYFCNYHDGRWLGKKWCVFDHLGYRKRITSIYKRDGGYAFYFKGQQKKTWEGVSWGIGRKLNILLIVFCNLVTSGHRIIFWFNEFMIMSQKIGRTNHGTMITMSECGKKFPIDNIDDDLRTSLEVFVVSSVRLCWMIMVFWFPLFFFKLTLSKSKNYRISEIFAHQCQGHALVSVKANGLPVHFWRKKIPKLKWL